MSTLKVSKTASGKFTWTLYGQRNNAIAQAPEGGFASRQNLLRSLETARTELGAADIQDTTKTRGTAAAGGPVRARVAASVASAAAPTTRRTAAKKSPGTAAKRTRTAKKAPAATIEEVTPAPAKAAPAKRTRARKAAKS